MTALALVTAFLCASAVGVAVFLALRSRPPEAGLSLLQQQLESLRAQTAEALSSQSRLVAQQVEAVARAVNDSQKTVGDRLDNAARVVGEVQRTLGELGQSSQRIFDVGRDIAGLQDLLKSCRQRFCLLLREGTKIAVDFIPNVSGLLNGMIPGHDRW